MFWRDCQKRSQNIRIIACNTVKVDELRSNVSVYRIVDAVLNRFYSDTVELNIV